MIKIHFTQQELMFMCHDMVSLESTQVKMKEKREFYDTFFKQIPVNWDESADGREIELLDDHWDEVVYYIKKGMKAWIAIGGDPDFHADILDKIEEIIR